MLDALFFNIKLDLLGSLIFAFTLLAICFFVFRYIIENEKIFYIYIAIIIILFILGDLAYPINVIKNLIICSIVTFFICYVNKNYI